MLQKEEDHLCKALKKCKYPIWAINRAKLKSQNPTRKTNRNNNNQTGQNISNNKKLTHGGPIPTRAKWEDQEHLQKIWGTGTL